MTTNLQVEYALTELQQATQALKGSPGMKAAIRRQAAQRGHRAAVRESLKVIKGDKDG